MSRHHFTVIYMTPPRYPRHWWTPREVRQNLRILAMVLGMSDSFLLPYCVA